MAAPRKNAIVQRFDRLSDQWNAFAQHPVHRLLRWLAADDEFATLEAFLHAQSEGAMEIPDLFIRLEPPFTDLPGYSVALLDALAAQLDAAAAVFTELGRPLDAPWVPAGFDRHQPGTLLRTVEAVRARCDGLAELLVLVLVPAHIDKSAAWQRWLYELLHAGVPADVRVIVLDRKSQPMLSDLARAAGSLMKTVEPELDMPGALQELASEGLDRGPGAIFRKRLIELGNLLPGGDLGQIKARAQAALAIARRENWPDQQVVVWTLVASACAQAGQIGEAVQAHRAAAKAGETAVAASHPAGHKLVGNAHLGEGSVHFSEQSYPDAAQSYQRAALAFEQAQDAFLTMESWRMSATAWHCADSPDPAWRCAWQGLRHAAALPPSQLPQTTFPYLATLLWQLAQRAEYIENQPSLRQRFVDLAGEDFAFEHCGRARA